LKITVRMILTAFAGCVVLAGCSTAPRRSVEASPHYKVGAPYKVAGRWYYPQVDENYRAVGVASWYGAKFHGRLTANGEIYDMNRLSAAHTTLPLPSMVEVENLENGRKLIVRVNDRGPFVEDRVIDLSRAAARRLGFEDKGLARVRVRYIGAARLADAAPSARRSGQKLARQAVAPPVAPPVAPAVGAPSGVDEGADEIANLIATIETAGFETPEQAPAPEQSPVMVSAYAPAPSSAGVIDISNLDRAPAGDHRYVIKVGALSMLDNISGARSALSQYGAVTLTREEPEGGEPLYHFKLGPFEDFHLAKARLEKVRGAGYNGAWLVGETP